jgi:hypothetical protein
MSANTTTMPALDSTVDVVLDADSVDFSIVPTTLDQYTSVHNHAIEVIAGMIVGKYMDDGARNLSIGKLCYDHAMWQRKFVGDRWVPMYFDNLCNRIRDEVAPRVQISIKSIRIGEWVRAYLLADALGAHNVYLMDNNDDTSTPLFSYHELAIVATSKKALAFDLKDLSFALRAGWFIFFSEIADLRRSGERVSSDEFKTRVEAREKAIAEAFGDADPVKEAIRAQNEAARKRTAEMNASNERVVSSIGKALVESHMTPALVLAALQNACAATKLEFPAKPNGAALEDSDMEAFVNAMMERGPKGWESVGKMASLCCIALGKAGKIKPLEKIHNSIGKVIDLHVELAQSSQGPLSEPSETPAESKAA